jgi:hypothetical protein
LELARLRIPPNALPDGTAPGSEILLQQCLHEVKALLNLQQYLKKLHPPENVAARQQSTILKSITQVVNGQPSTRQSKSTNASSVSLVRMGSSTAMD